MRQDREGRPPPGLLCGLGIVLTAAAPSSLLFFRLQVANEVTFTRLKQTLERLSKAYSGGTRSSCEAWGMLDCVFGPGLPSFSSTLGGFSNEEAERDVTYEAAEGGEGKPVMGYFSPNLDESQKRSVRHALRAQDLAIVHGPPGTGKTTTVVEIVLQEAIRR